MRQGVNPSIPSPKRMQITQPYQSVAIPPEKATLAHSKLNAIGPQRAMTAGRIPLTAGATGSSAPWRRSSGASPSFPMRGLRIGRSLAGPAVRIRSGLLPSACLCTRTLGFGIPAVAPSASGTASPCHGARIAKSPATGVNRALASARALSTRLPAAPLTPAAAVPGCEANRGGNAAPEDALHAAHAPLVIRSPIHPNGRHCIWRRSCIRHPPGVVLQTQSPDVRIKPEYLRNVFSRVIFRTEFPLVSTPRTESISLIR